MENSHNNDQPQSSRPVRKTRGIPPLRYGDGITTLNFGGGLPRTPQGPLQTYSNRQHDNWNSEQRNETDNDVVSVHSHQTHVTNRSRYSTASSHTVRSNHSAVSVRSTHSAANVLSGVNAANRIVQRSASLRSLDNVPRQKNGPFHSNYASTTNLGYTRRDSGIVNEIARREKIQRQALLEAEAAERARDEAYQQNFANFENNEQLTYSDIERVNSHVNQWVEDQRQSRNVSPAFSRDVSPAFSRPRMDDYDRHNGRGRRRYENPRSNVNNHEKLLSDAFKALTYNKRIKDLPEFSGAIREWPVFFNEFERSTIENEISDSENLRRLHKALTKDARKAVLSLMTQPENVGTIIKVLQKNFGQNEWVIATLIEDMKALPNLKAEDVNDFRDFYNSVIGTVTTIRNMNCEHYLANPDLLACLVQKLPYFSRSLWAHSKAELMRNQEIVTLHHFSLWLEDELDAQFANYNPSNQGPSQSSTQAAGSYQKKNQYGKEFPKKAHMFNHSEVSEKPCVCCDVVPRHPLYKCEKFLELSTDQRREFAAKKALCYCCLNTGHGKGQCNSKGRCKECGAKHHTVLHQDSSNKESITKPVMREQSLFVNETTHSNTLLRCGKVKLKGKNGCVEAFAIFDDGSTASQMEDSLARELELDGPTVPITYCWTRNITAYDAESRVVQTEIAGPGNNSKFYHLKNVRTVKNLSLPTISFNLEKITSLYPNIETEKLMTIQNAKPRLLIGSNNSGLITPYKSFSYSLYGLQLSHCRLGWTIHGDIEHFIPSEKEYSFHVYTIPGEIEDENITQIVKKSYEMEDFGMKIQTEKLSEDDQRAIDIMQRTMKPINDRYEIGQLYKYDDFVFPESKKMALRRLTLIEKKMDCDENYANLYCNKIQEYVDKGYAKKLNEDEVPRSSRNWYLPHFGVTNPNKPGNFRFVMDAKAKSHGYSLNDLLLKGPDLVPPLQAILWRGRLKDIMVMADIKEMFHQVLIREDDQCSQMFLFRGKERDRPPDTYIMPVMIFGAVSSPSAAQFVKNENAKAFERETPGVYRAITKQHYVDDYFDSVDDEDIAIKLVHDVINAHKKGGFKLMKFVSNSDKLLESLPEELRAERDPEKPTERILGLTYNIVKDAFIMSLKFDKFELELIQGKKIPTKREFLQFMMTVFDPLGFLSPIMIKLKLLYQDLWRLDIKWDCEVPNEIFYRWQTWLKETRELDFVEIPRCYFPGAKPFRAAELHTFCDASDRAFVAVVYLRIEQEDKTHISMISSKAKVAPMKTMTVPRLELQATVTGALLCDTIIGELGIDVIKKRFWTDSKVVLSWLRSREKLNVFIGPRVSTILDKSKVTEWMWLPTGLNIADLATKEHELTQLSMKNWINGPEFLQFGEDKWPKQDSLLLNPTENVNYHSGLEIVEFSNVHTTTDDLELPDVARFSNYFRLIRTTAYYLKMLVRLQMRSQEKPKEFKIDMQDMNRSRNSWYRKVQLEEFLTEHNDLEKTGYVKVSSRLRTLSPFLHEGVIRMSGRMPNALNFEENNPIILPSKHPFTELLIKSYHEANLHVGVSTVVNQLRKRFRILKCRQAVKRVFANCLVCRQKKLTTQNIKMAPLPYQRTEPNVYPFTYVGMDYFGPIQVKYGRRLEKHWVCMFSCLSIRAIHMEIVHSLTTNSCIMAIQRFVNIRGIPREIIADNGTSFIGAKNEWRQALTQLDDEAIREKLLLKNIKWKFNCPGAPHQAGATERMIGSVKRTLKIIMNEQHPSYEVLSTTLSEIMNVMNNRPLTHVLNDDEEMCSITPNDILIGRTNGEQSELEVTDRDMLGKKIWKCSQVYADRFWKRWLKEYRPEILKRTNWFDDRKEYEFKVGDVVMVIDESLKRGNWPKGRIEEIHRNSSDKKVRNVVVKTKDGVYRRPTNKLALVVSSA